jgi:hypothetical protein
METADTVEPPLRASPLVLLSKTQGSNLSADKQCIFDHPAKLFERPPEDAAEE